MTDIIKFNGTHTVKETTQAHDIKTKLFNLFMLTSSLTEPDVRFTITDDNGTETPATQQKLAKALRTNLVELTDSLGYSVDEVTENQVDEQEQPQENVKSIIEELQDMTFKAHELSAGDPTIFGHLVSAEIDRVAELLGLTELSITAEVKDKLPATTIKKELQYLYSLNDSMITGDPNHIPTYDDGTVIKQSDLADMNMNALDLIAEMLGFELEEGATPVKTKGQVVYDKLPAADKLNVDMLNKLHEVQDHILKSGQTAVGANRITTAVTLLEAGLGVIDHEEE